jgi:hypothetical protein
VTVAELIEFLQEAVKRGLPEDTTVVIETEMGYLIADTVNDPTRRDGYDMWFTIFTGMEADSRYTPGGLPDLEEPEPLRDAEGREVHT